MDTIVLDGGEALEGELQHKSFSIITDIGTLKIPKEKIAQIMFNVGACGGKDQIYTYESRYTGDVVEDPIKMKLEDSGDIVKVPQKKIVAVHVG